MLIGLGKRAKRKSLRLLFQLGPGKLNNNGNGEETKKESSPPKIKARSESKWPESSDPLLEDTHNKPQVENLNLEAARRLSHYTLPKDVAVASSEVPDFKILNAGNAVGETATRIETCIATQDIPQSTILETKESSTLLREHSIKEAYCVNTDPDGKAVSDRSLSNSHQALDLSTNNQAKTKVAKTAPYEKIDSTSRIDPTYNAQSREECSQTNQIVSDHGDDGLIESSENGTPRGLTFDENISISGESDFELRRREDRSSVGLENLQEAGSRGSGELGTDKELLLRSGDGVHAVYASIQNNDICIGQSSPPEVLSPKRLISQKASNGDHDISGRSRPDLEGPVPKSVETNPKHEIIDIVSSQHVMSAFPLGRAESLAKKGRERSSSCGNTSKIEAKGLIDIPPHSSHSPLPEISAIKNHEVCSPVGDTVATEIPKLAPSQPEGSMVKTRSGIRFSDDTNMLRDFLIRERARKAAKPLEMPICISGPLISSPFSPRKALAEKDSNSPTPQKPPDLANRPQTSPGTDKMEVVHSHDSDEVAIEPLLRRCSTRKRLFSTTNAAPATPGFIPVRRAGGVEPIVLQKSVAQELAIITRANTRRNKGESKPPKFRLRTLPADGGKDVAGEAMVHGHTKSVGWDKTLVYYRDVTGLNEGMAEKEREKEEKQPRLRRLRNLGAANGTPAPRKMATETGWLESGSTATRRGQRR